ncbi:hypothetical protein [Streptomyces xinghaiensis]|uniref:hypothetical protein n=1 Tax=Streptomyces xinghaiensis TaxID=1038928 RepID=UPI0002F63E34|nr:hypothetical protein [Streptomyces xinghaiensis]MZE81036.1 hypothetical protein [Streptomyces sp. SID5475]
MTRKPIFARVTVLLTAALVGSGVCLTTADHGVSRAGTVDRAFSDTPWPGPGGTALAGALDDTPWPVGP